MAAGNLTLSPQLLLAAERKVYSQNSEDGVLLAIFNAIGHFGSLFVEVGVSKDVAPDGVAECNTRWLAERWNWCGVWIDAERPERSIPLASSVRFIRLFVRADRISELLAVIPRDPDLLSIDIDHQDYWVLRALLSNGYRPRVICCEYNASCGPTARLVVAEEPDAKWDGTDYFGASLAAMVALCEDHEYWLVYCESSGNNAFFIRRPCLPAGYLPVPVADLWRTPMYGTAPGGGHPKSERKMIARG